MPSPFKLIEKLTARAGPRTTEKAGRLAGPAARQGEEELRSYARQHWGEGSEPYTPPLPASEIPGDVARSAVTGARSGVEGFAGMGGDANDMIQALAAYAAEKAGRDPDAWAAMAKYGSPLSLLPNSDQVSEASNRLFGQDDWTRHEAKSPFGQAAETGVSTMMFPSRKWLEAPGAAAKMLGRMF